MSHRLGRMAMRASPPGSSILSGSLTGHPVEDVQNLAHPGEGPAPGSGAPVAASPCRMRSTRVRREVMSAVRAYELMIIFDESTDEAVVERILQQGGAMIAAGGGRVAKTDRWGRKRFAYEINHKWEGIYVVL